MYIKHSRQCLITLPNTCTLKFVKNTLLQVIFQLSSWCLEMWSSTVFCVCIIYVRSHGLQWP